MLDAQTTAAARGCLQSPLDLHRHDLSHRPLILGRSALLYTSILPGCVCVLARDVSPHVLTRPLGLFLLTQSLATQKYGTEFSVGVPSMHRGTGVGIVYNMLLIRAFRSPVLRTEGPSLRTTWTCVSVGMCVRSDHLCFATGMPLGASHNVSNLNSDDFNVSEMFIGPPLVAKVRSRILP